MFSKYFLLILNLHLGFQAYAAWPNEALRAIGTYDRSLFYADQQRALQIIDDEFTKIRKDKGAGDYAEHWAERDIPNYRPVRDFLRRVEGAESTPIEQKLMALKSLAWTGVPGIRERVIAALGQVTDDRSVTCGLEALMRLPYAPANEIAPTLRVIEKFANRVSFDVIGLIKKTMTLPATSVFQGDPSAPVYWVAQALFDLRSTDDDRRLILNALNAIDELYVSLDWRSTTPVVRLHGEELYWRIVEDPTAPVKLKEAAISQLGRSPNPETMTKLASLAEAGELRIPAAVALANALNNYHEYKSRGYEPAKGWFIFPYKCFDHIAEVYLRVAAQSDGTGREVAKILHGAITNKRILSDMARVAHHYCLTALLQ